MNTLKHTLLITLSGSLAGAVAVEWTDAAAPGETDWQPCQRRHDGSWRLASRDPAASPQRHLREPGLFAGLGLRYRMTAQGPWSPVPTERKEITIVAVTPEQQSAPPAPASTDWSALALVSVEGVETAAFTLAGRASGAVAVAWTEAATPAEADWRPCIALGEDRWRLGAPLAHDPTKVTIRYRLSPEGGWSPAAADRRSLDLAGLPPIASPPLLLTAPVLLGASATIGQAMSVIRASGAAGRCRPWASNGAGTGLPSPARKARATSRSRLTTAAS